MDRMPQGCDAARPGPAPLRPWPVSADPRAPPGRHPNTDRRGRRNGDGVCPPIPSSGWSSPWPSSPPTRSPRSGAGSTRPATSPSPTDSAFSQARRRLGVAPLRHLFLETARPMATHQTVGRLLPRLAADGPRRHHARPARHPGQRPRLRPAHDRPGRGGLPPGPAAGPLRAGHARRLRPGDQAAPPRRAVDGRPVARPPRARACS